MILFFKQMIEVTDIMKSAGIGNVKDGLAGIHSSCK